MAIKKWCGKQCSSCQNHCAVDSIIPCSPDCENLTEDGMIIIKNCLKEKCEEVKYIFGMPNATDEEVVNMYGDVAPYPYSI